MSLLTGPQKDRLSEAVVGTFKEERLAQFLETNLSVRLIAIVKTGPLKEMTFELIGWLDAQARIVEFLAKLAPQYPNDEVLGSLLEVLGCSGDQIPAEKRIEEFLNTLKESPGHGHRKVRQTLEKNPHFQRLLEKNPHFQRLIEEAAKKETDSKTVVLRGAAAGPAKFDLHTEEVKTAIRAKLDLIKGCRVLDEHGIQVGTLDLIAEKLNLSASQNSSNLSGQLAASLTKSCFYRDLGKLLNVFERLRVQKKYDEARRIGEIMDLMLPLCLPPRVVSEAWQQLEHDSAVLIRSGVGGKTGAELLVSRLYGKGAKFIEKASNEPTGELFVAFYESVPIGDPNSSAKAMLQGLYLATHHADLNEDERQKIEIRLTFEEIRSRLRGHYEHIRDNKERPSYCVVKLPPQENDVINLSNFLRELGIPDLLFIGIGLARDPETDRIEGYVMSNLNARYKWANEG